MHRLTFLCTIGLCLVPTPSIHAGLYHLTEPVIGPAASGSSVQALAFADFRKRLAELIQAGNDQLTSPSRTHYLERRDELERKQRRGTLTIEESIDLSADLIRLKQYDAAIEVLTPLARERARDNFFVIANLITAHFLNGQLPLASEYLYQVEKRRPPAAGRITQAQADWFAQVEPYFGKLIRLRRREARTPPGAPKPGQTLDNLFDVRFVGESGQYEAGRLAAAERAKLPRDAVAIVQQLILWLPNDTRLYWLLGELLNAQGDLADAATVFAECRDNRRFDALELPQHQHLIQEALAQAPVASSSVPLPDLGAAETPRSWFAGKGNLLIVAAFVGLVIALLGYLQWRELRRRSRPSMKRERE